MARSLIALALALALLTPGVLSATSGSTLSLTAASFAADPSTVFDNTNAAAGTAGVDVTAWGTTFTEAWFGPASTNTTVITYALDAGSSTFSKVIARVSNGSLVSNDTADTTLYAKISEATASFTSVTYLSKKVAVGLGSIAVAYTINAGTTYTADHQNLYLLIVNSAGSVVVNKAIVNAADVLCVDATTDGKAYKYNIGNVFYENSTYYVSYSTVTLTYAKGGTCPTVAAGTATSTSVETKASIQGYAVDSSATVKWTNPVDFVTSTTLASGTFQPLCGPSNYTNSTTLYCTAYSDATTTRTINAYGITVSSGVVASTTAIAADSVPATGTIKYTVGGFVYGMYQQGILLNCLTTTTTGPVYANTLNLYNFTSGATSTTGATSGGIVLSGYTTATQTGIFSGAGVQNGTGFVLLTQYQSATATTGADTQTPAITTFQYASYNGSASRQGDIVTLGTVATASGNYFADAYGALWFGAYSYGYTTDATAGNSGTASEIYKGQVGKVITQLYSDAGNVLASFFALLSIMIAALFAF